MPRRPKPLEWYDSTAGDGQIPGCMKCADLWFNPLFREAVFSVSIEHPGSPGELARRTVNQFHERRHPMDMAAAVDP